MTFKGIVHIHAVPRDGSDFPAGVVWVSVFIDDVLLERKTAEPYVFVWDTRTVPSGTHVITSTASDAAGNVGEAPRLLVEVDNAPPAFQLMITGPEVSLSANGREVASGATPLSTRLVLPKKTPPSETVIDLKVETKTEN